MTVQVVELLATMKHTVAFVERYPGHEEFVKPAKEIHDTFKEALPFVLLDPIALGGPK